MEHNAQKIGGIELPIKSLELLPLELLEHCWRQADHLYVHLAFGDIWPINILKCTLLLLFNENPINFTKIVQAQQVFIRLYGHFAAIQRTSNNYARNLTLLLPNSKNLSLIEDITHLYTTDIEIFNKCNEKRRENSLPSLIFEKIEENQLHNLSKSLGEANLPSDYMRYNFNYKAFNCVSLAGTFDRLHFDHKILITLSSLVAKNKLVTAVLTVLGGKKHQELIEDVQTRAERVKRFLAIIDTTIAEKDLQIVTRCPNSDGCRLMNDPEIEAAVVENNEEGINGITRVNALRVEKFNLQALTVVWKHSCRIVSSTDLREWLASTAKVDLGAERGIKQDLGCE